MWSYVTASSSTFVGLTTVGPLLRVSQYQNVRSTPIRPELGMSERTPARRFEAELGMSFRDWRRRLRLFNAIELLGGGLDVTR